MRINKNLSLFGVGLVITTITLTSGCKTTKDERSDGRALDDKHITENVEKALKDEPTYKFTDINVNTFAGIVNLSGFVNSETQKARAEQLARGVSGVSDVSNGLVLKPEIQPTGRTNMNSRIYAEPQNAQPGASTHTNPNAQPK